jgi:hypothetical protein
MFSQKSEFYWYAWVNSFVDGLPHIRKGEISQTLIEISYKLSSDIRVSLILTTFATIEKLMEI